MKLLSGLILIGSAIAAVGLVGAGAFFGSTALILAGMIGVPVLLIGLGVVQYVNVAQRTGGLREARERHFQDTCGRWSERLDEAITTAQEAGIPETEIEGFVAELEEAVDPHAEIMWDEGSLRIRATEEEPSGGWIHRAELAIQEALDAAGSNAETRLEERLEDLDHQLDEATIDPALPSGSLHRVTSAYLDRTEDALPAIEDRLHDVGALIEDAEGSGVDTSSARDHNRTARDHLEAGRPLKALHALKDARREAYDRLTPRFEDRVSRVREALGGLEELPVHGVVEPTTVDRIDELRRSVDDLDLQDDSVQDLEEIERELADVAGAFDDAIRGTARSTQEDIEEYPPLADESRITDVVKGFENTPKISYPYEEHFDEWISTMEQNLPLLQEAIQQAALVPHIDELEEMIEQKLGETGVVTPEDLPLRQGNEDVLALYARANPDDATWTGNQLRGDQLG